MNRRRFITTSGAALLGLTGCRQLDFVSSKISPQLDVLPFVAPETVHVDPVSHVLARLTFGARPSDYRRVSEKGVDRYIAGQLEYERIDDTFCERQARRLESLQAAVGALFEYKRDFLLRELTQNQVVRAVYSKRQLYEVMVEFWTDHFNIDASKGDCAWLIAADQREVIRKHALGSFPAMLRESALSPAMLWYLDGRQNNLKGPSDRPNENYARELLELHTLGVDGGYTQRDVMEVARCLTGWTVRSEEIFGKGRVEFREEFHDDGEKVVLGQAIPAGRGEGDLDAVLSVVSTHDSTARYLARKLCAAFISDDPPEEAVAAVAGAFRRSDGHIPTVLEALFDTPAFWTSAGQKVKRPFRYLVSALRASGARTDGGAACLDYLVRLGHAPFQYPTPDGYPMEPEPWMGTMMWRWHFAAVLSQNKLPETDVDWAGLEQHFGSSSALASHLLGRQPSAMEAAAYGATNFSPAVLLASPAFQRY